MNREAALLVTEQTFIDVNLMVAWNASTSSIIVSPPSGSHR